MEVIGNLVPQNEKRLAQTALRIAQVGGYDIEGDFRGFLGGIAIRAGADGRKADGSRAMFLGQFQAGEITSGQLLRFAVSPIAIDGSDGVKYAEGPNIKPKHNAAYWEKATAGFNFAEADAVPTARFNRVLWKGLMGRKPYPALRGSLVTTRDDD